MKIIKSDISNYESTYYISSNDLETAQILFHILQREKSFIVQMTDEEAEENARKQVINSEYVDLEDSILERLPQKAQNDARSAKRMYKNLYGKIKSDQKDAEFFYNLKKETVSGDDILQLVSLVDMVQEKLKYNDAMADSRQSTRQIFEYVPVTEF